MQQDVLSADAKEMENKENERNTQIHLTFERCCRGGEEAPSLGCQDPLAALSLSSSFFVCCCFAPVLCRRAEEGRGSVAHASLYTYKFTPEKEREEKKDRASWAPRNRLPQRGRRNPRRVTWGREEKEGVEWYKGGVKHTSQSGTGARCGARGGGEVRY